MSDVPGTGILPILQECPVKVSPNVANLVVWVTFGFDAPTKIEIVTVWRKRFREVFQVFDKDKLQNVGKLCLVHRLNFKITYWGGFVYHTIELYCTRGKYPKMLQCDI